MKRIWFELRSLEIEFKSTRDPYLRQRISERIAVLQRQVRRGR